MPEPRRLLPLPVVLAALAAWPGPAAAGPEPPPELIEMTEAASAQCREIGGAPSILPRYQTVIDLNGDGREDFLTDLAGLQCKDAWSAFCGSAGCPVAAWLSEPGGGHVRFDFGYLQGFEIAHGTGALPEVVAAYHGAACGADRTGAERCTRRWVFASNAPPTPPIEEPGPEPTPAAAPESAAVPPPELPPGWTLRNVPGSSPVALGMGTGNIATLAAFCLEGQPFLAVTFHQRPEGAKVALAFAFSQGAIAVEAGFEETAGGAFVVPLEDQALAARLAGRDAEVAVEAGGRDEGVLSLKGSTRALRGALEACHAF